LPFSGDKPAHNWKMMVMMIIIIIIITGTSDIRTMNSYIRIVATQYSLGTWFVSGI
jgi:hypothetical protein